MTMPSPSDLPLSQFSGKAPLFPLPNVVLLPQATLPLHIFEPRYRQMTADALRGERLIAMSLIDDRKPSADPVAIHPIVGLGKIIAHEELDDGRYLLVLQGVARARVLHEDNHDLPYRIGNLQLLNDVVPEVADFDRTTRAEEIVSLFCRLFPGHEFQRLIQQAMTANLPLGQICDVIASALPMEMALAQQFLEELNSDLRSQMLWQLLKQMKPAKGSKGPKLALKSFPPAFSVN